MRACGVAAPGAPVTVFEMPDPQVPGPGQALLAVDAAGVGAWDRLLPNAEWRIGLTPPAALGVEGAGRVIAVGPDVERFAAGDEVLVHEAPLPGGSGFWAEQVLISAEHASARPTSLAVGLAGALPVSGLTAWQALTPMRLSPGQRLLVTGGGGSTGRLVVALALHQWLQVTVTASPSSAAPLLEMGVAEVVDYHDPDWPRHLAAGFDAAITAAPGTAVDALDLVRDGGTLCSLTSDSPPPRRGISMRDLFVHPDGEVLSKVAAFAAAGVLRLDCEEVALADGPDVFRRVAGGAAGGHKYVLKP